MNGEQIVAFFVWPFVVLAFALIIYWFTGWQDRQEGLRRAAAHPSRGSSPNSSMPKPDRPT
ncbi:hypothetical protein MPOCJGCO_1945 [Methylobacterium trifolii]|uniref:Cbb3-type cytochrome c oxidase subunit 3 n=1 Tax=Methylobacterium trifolii TaxID=1003092 RepID=A0ABQ4U0M7_9HYPH|nr:hypothetical protein MPOCJGCO_1945 [Methylobacterium trifolii]